MTFSLCVSMSNDGKKVLVRGIATWAHCSRCGECAPDSVTAYMYMYFGVSCNNTAKCCYMF